MSVTIREAQAGDAPFVSWAINTAARSHRPIGWFDIMLGTPEPEVLAFLKEVVTAECRSWWHWSKFLIADDGGRAIAALCRFRAGDGYGLSEEAIAEVVKRRKLGEAELQAMWNRGAYMFSCLMEPHDDFWTVENVGRRCPSTVAAASLGHLSRARSMTGASKASAMRRSRF